MKKRGLFIALMLVLISALVVTACSGRQGNTKNGSNTGDPQTEGGGSSSEPVTVEFSLFSDSTKAFPRVVEQFNETHTDIQIKIVELPPVPSDQMSRYTTWFNSKSKTPDISLIEVTQPQLFAAADWIAPLDEYFDEAYLDRFFPAAREVALYNDELYGIQAFLDVGMLFYRTDLLEKYNKPVPQTWSEMEQISQEILAAENDPNLTGYIFQAKKVEGATINYLEYVWGLGGSIIDEQGKIKVDSEIGIEAMKTMRDLVYESEISPVSVSTSAPNDNSIVFGNGNAIFMRNWPSFYSVLQDSKVAGKYDVTNMPYTEGNESTGHAVSSGWAYVINKNSVHKEEAVEVMKYLLSDEAQTFLAKEGFIVPSVKQVFDDQDVIETNPLFSRLPDILAQAKNRPISPIYDQVSRAMQTEINLVMSGQKDPEQAMKDAQVEIDKIQQ